MNETLAAYKARVRTRVVLWVGVAALVGGFVVRGKAADWSRNVTDTSGMITVTYAHSPRLEDFYRTAGTYLLGLSLVLFAVVARRWTQPPVNSTAVGPDHPAT